MKTLANHTLLYDEDCPLCRAYTSAFVQTGMLDENGRTSFCTLSQNNIGYLDLKRASNEIALIDRKNQSVIYGIDGLLAVIGNSFPTVRKIGNLKPVHLSLQKLYSLISYNRKVIIPGKPNDGKTLRCVPDFSYKYRLAYVFIAAIFTAFVLNLYAKQIQLIPSGNFGGELALAFGQILFQGTFLLNTNGKTILTYIGNLMTVSLMGALLLLPMLILTHFAHVGQTTILGWFGLTVTLMFLEHYRRINLLQLPKFLSVTWIIFRLIALLIILNL